MAGVGDVDGDGWDDVLVGAPGHDGAATDTGAAYLFHGPMVGTWDPSIAAARLFGEAAFRYLKWVYFLPGVVFAGVTNVDQLWALANISVAASAIPNLIALLMLSGVFMTLMRDYLSGDARYTTRRIDASRAYVRIAAPG